MCPPSCSMGCRRTGNQQCPHSSQLLVRDGSGRAPRLPANSLFKSCKRTVDTPQAELNTGKWREWPMDRPESLIQVPLLQAAPQESGSDERDRKAPSFCAPPRPSPLTRGRFWAFSPFQFSADRAGAFDLQELFPVAVFDQLNWLNQCPPAPGHHPAAPPAFPVLLQMTFQRQSQVPPWVGPGSSSIVSSSTFQTLNRLSPVVRQRSGAYWTSIEEYAHRESAACNPPIRNHLPGTFRTKSSSSNVTCGLPFDSYCWLPTLQLSFHDPKLDLFEDISALEVGSGSNRVWFSHLPYRKELHTGHVQSPTSSTTNISLGPVKSVAFCRVPVSTPSLADVSHRCCMQRTRHGRSSCAVATSYDSLVLLSLPDPPAPRTFGKLSDKTNKPPYVTKAPTSLLQNPSNR
ncbi:hypothetical protein QBC40DRAFT_352728 [Triangularia verruculosa]|uniref:Uncharacterized protein n=1 Tax=Triangularia verruculosa TaxID=2587418 RepID=A0AAN6X9B1_9PEZI|nr:hypothetical protein QBC40DRAFT_352728 [Triangularia verruculosa]